MYTETLDDLNVEMLEDLQEELNELNDEIKDSSIDELKKHVESMTNGEYTIVRTYNSNENDEDDEIDNEDL